MTGPKAQRACVCVGDWVRGALVRGPTPPRRHRYRLKPSRKSDLDVPHPNALKQTAVVVRATRSNRSDVRSPDDVAAAAAAPVLSSGPQFIRCPSRRGDISPGRSSRSRRRTDKRSGGGGVARRRRRRTSESTRSDAAVAMRIRRGRPTASVSAGDHPAIGRLPVAGPASGGARVSPCYRRITLPFRPF